MLKHPEPTAEQVVQAVEAIYLMDGVSDTNRIADFTSFDVSVPYQRQLVENSVSAAEMLRLIVPLARRSNQYGFSVLVPLIVKARDEDKRVLFRVHLEQFGLFRLFVERLRAGPTPQEAARQVCAVQGSASDATVVRQAFESWGSYALSLVLGESGQYVPAASPESADLLRRSLEDLARQDHSARQFVLEYLGQEAYEFIEGNVRDSVVDAIVMVFNGCDAEKVVLKLDKAYEDFLRLMGYRRVDLSKAHGIGQLGNDLKSRGLIAAKHLGAVNLIGHIRNATDHGGDPNEGNKRWLIGEAVTRLMALSILSSIRSIVCYRGGRLEL
jgi:hypothetical protein